MAREGRPGTQTRGRGLQTPRLVATTLLVLLLTHASWHDSWHVLAQQSNPLAGQGTSPCDAGLTDYCKLKVFTSIELQRLQDIDDRNYEFAAVLNVDQTWYDPRAESAWAIIEARDRAVPDATNSSVYSSAILCAAAKGGVNLTSQDCRDATDSPPDCKKYCTVQGQSTDNPYRCCDLIWLPEMSLTNLIESTQDRVVYDHIFPIIDFETNDTYVHRTTRVHGKFYSPLDFHDYPYDQQDLHVFFDPTFKGVTDFVVAPSATFRHLIPEISTDSQGSVDISKLTHDELAGWSINNVTFNCTSLFQLASQDGTNASDNSLVNLWVENQDYDPHDPVFQVLNHTDPKVLQELLVAEAVLCSLTIGISRLSSTLTAQSILPVAFVGALAFVVFFSAPDMLDFRLGTEVTLFLALTAVQFVFVAILPVTSYLTAFDIFILLTYCTIVAIVIENLIVYYISTREEVEVRASKSGLRSSKTAEYEGLLVSSRQLDNDLTNEKNNSNSNNFSDAIGADSNATGADSNATGADSIQHMPGHTSGDPTQAQGLKADGPGSQGAVDGVSTSTGPKEGDLEEGELPFVHQEMGQDTFSSGAQGASAGPLEGGKWGGTGEEKGGGQAVDDVGSSGSFVRTMLGSRAKSAGFIVPLKPIEPVKLIRQTDKKFAEDSSFAYRVARMIDRAAGVIIFFVYVLLSVLNFTVGFN